MNGPFDPAAIEKKIDELLKASGGALKRSSLLTLVIVHPRERQAETARHLDYVFGKRPLRVIRIETGYDTPTTVDVSARCKPHQAGQEVCFQEIVFYSGPDGHGLNPALWQPLIIRDLPAVLFCLEEIPLLMDLLDKMDFTPDKCLVDTGSTTSSAGLAHSLACLSELGKLAGKGTVTANLSWRAITGYRQLTARLFDDPLILPMLEELACVIFYGMHPHDSLLLSLWLAARLGWKKGRRQEETLLFSGMKNRDIEVSLSVGAEPRFSILFQTGSGAKTFIKRVDDTTIVLSAGGREQREVFEESGCEQCLLDEIDRLTPDRAWLEVLALARTVNT